jgi:hypothetical protein
MAEGRVKKPRISDDFEASSIELTSVSASSFSGVCHGIISAVSRMKPTNASAAITAMATALIR